MAVAAPVHQVGRAGGPHVGVVERLEDRRRRRRRGGRGSCCRSCRSAGGRGRTGGRRGSSTRTRRSGPLSRWNQFIDGIRWRSWADAGDDRGGADGRDRGKTATHRGRRGRLTRSARARRGALLDRVEHLGRHRVDHAENQLGSGRASSVLRSAAQDAQAGVLLSGTRAAAPQEPHERRQRHIAERVKQRRRGPPAPVRRRRGRRSGLPELPCRADAVGRPRSPGRPSTGPPRRLPDLRSDRATRRRREPRGYRRTAERPRPDRGPQCRGERIRPRRVLAGSAHRGQLEQDLKAEASASATATTTPRPIAGSGTCRGEAPEVAGAIARRPGAGRNGRRPRPPRGRFRGRCRRRGVHRMIHGAVPSRAMTIDHLRHALGRSGRTAASPAA